MSYNVLADRYITTEKYQHCAKSTDFKEYRAKVIAREMAFYEPDIVCFQELTREMKESYPDCYFRDIYDCTPLVQILSKSMRTSMTGQNIEGIAIYFVRRRWELVEHIVVPLDQFSLSRNIS